MCGKRRVDVRCVVVDHLRVVIGDVTQVGDSECMRMDCASSFKSDKL